MTERGALDAAIARLQTENKRLISALQAIEECYVKKFNGSIVGLKSGVELSRPFVIAHDALKQKAS